MFDIPSEVSDVDAIIHPTAIVEKGARIGRGVKIGPYSIIGPQVELQDGVQIGSHVVIEHRTTVGERTVIYPFSTIGVFPQDLKYRREPAELVIGPENSIRQYVNISIGTEGGGGKTVIGRGNLFMVYSHVAHDCHVGDYCILANGVSLGGHVKVNDWTVIGGHAAVHQFCRLGQRTMVAGGAMVVQDVPPFCMVHGDRAVPNGINVVGLRRAGVQSEDFRSIKTMYKMLYKDQMTLEEAMSQIEKDVPPSDYRKVFLEFLGSSKRGICR